MMEPRLVDVKSLLDPVSQSPAAFNMTVPLKHAGQRCQWAPCEQECNDPADFHCMSGTKMVLAAPYFCSAEIVWPTQGPNPAFMAQIGLPNLGRPGPRQAVATDSGTRSPNSERRKLQSFAQFRKLPASSYQILSRYSWNEKVVAVHQLLTAG
jgi:hypothetical protein